MSIELTNFKADITVAIKKTAVTMDDISAVATEGLGRVLAYLVQQRARISGAPYLAYFNASEDFSRFDVELGIPVSEEVAVEGEFFMSKNCDGKAVCGVHIGAYKDIEVVYVALMDYLAANKLESTGVYYDYYISDPANTPESELRTKVVFPVK
ncbi:MAG: GyrI-like domain-containing protein [Peptococcaceae bacterium]|jgi:effector-binding domain-containing protein|nr:GyrI-like domain-containing protein [Peptococcaceae bacterium]